MANGIVYIVDESGQLNAFALPSMPINAAVVEFYDASLDHYFLSALESEIHALDNGLFPGWARTGQTLNAYATAVAGANPVCRFYLPPAYAIRISILARRSNAQRCSRSIRSSSTNRRRCSTFCCPIKAPAHVLRARFRSIASGTVAPTRIIAIRRTGRSAIRWSPLDGGRKAMAPTP